MKKILLLQCFFLVAFSALAQNYKAFSPFYKETVKGDMLMVGNSVLNAGVNPNQPYTGSHGHNALIDLNYTNVAPATGVFNSSSANVANPNVNASCLKVKGAYLYWSAAYTRERELNQTSPKFERSKFKNIKFKTPNASSYTDLVGELVYDGYDVLSSRPNQNDSQRAYVYKKDVTSILTAEAATRGGRFDGTYTVANLMAPKGNESTGVGYAAGWTLVIVYEDLSKPSRYITLFDGFSAVNNINSLAIPISGFKTVPTGPVRAKFGFAALEGEIGISGDKLSINTDKGTYGISAPGRNLNNFFNSTITDENGVNTSRNPASTNLFGFDVGLFNLPPSIFNNNATSATLLPYTNQDAYYPFLFAFNVEVVEPHVVMEKRVYKGNQDITGNRGGVTVNLGEQLIYKVKFKNIGNDDAKDLVIVDKLPKGLDFVKTSIQPSNFPSGTHIDYTYGAEGGTLTVTVDNSLVKANSVTHEFSFGVEVVNDCKLWRAPCANQIKNEVVATYNGVENPKTTPIASKSFKSEFTSCFGGDEGTSDFVVNVDFLKCVYKEQVTHCKLTTTLKAEDGFTSYQWTTVSGTETVNATTQNLVVSAPGVYKVTKTKAGCSTMYEEFTVIPNTNEANHPVESMITSKQISGETYVCPSTGKKYPQVYLCGKNTTLNMRISITNATNFLWEKKVNCTNTPPNDCPPDLNSYGCGWTTVGNVNGRVTNQSFTEAGDYRLTVTYDAECVSSYYFRVTKNELDPKVEPLDIVCTTPGKITVKDVPATGYQFALMKGTTTVTNYQTSNIFTVPTAGSYNVLIKQTATNTAVVPCTFEISNIVINQKNPSLTVITTDMACDTNKGNMRIQVNDPPYNPYTIVVRENNQTGAELYRFTSSGTTTYNDITLNNYFNHGTYFVAVENSYGCTITKGGVKINKIPELKATASVFKPITNCAPGVIRITASGGKKVGSYDFEYNGTHNTSATDYFDLEVTTAGVYNFVVTDANGCTARASITITKLTPPVVTANYEIKQCGQQILINFTEPQSTYSYTYQYALEGKAPQTARTIAGLTANTTYTPTVLYTINGQTCTLTLPAITIPDLTATDNLIAAAGVVKLVGCEQGANANKALVRFSNVQGGVPPYEYSFDGGVSFGSVSQTWLLPGTYQLAVRDRHDCSRDNITIKVDDKIATPTFSTNLTYNCEGKATLKINNDKGTYTYTYGVDGGAPQNSNTFTNLAVGTHTIVIQYADANPPTKNVLFLEDFGVGTTHVKTPYINDSYVFEPQDGSTILYNRAGVGRANPYGPTVNDGEYTVVDKMRPNLWGDDPVDHTGKTNGRMLFVNIGSSAGVAGILYQRKMMDIIPNKPIQFSIALYNLIRGDGRTTATNDPNIKLELYKTEADALAQTNVLASNNIGYIPKHANVNDWKEYKVQLNPGNNTTLYAVVRSFSDVIGGNDLAIDDIYLYQEPEACPSTYTVTVVVSGDQAFGIQTNTQKVTNAKCNNGTGSYQISIKNPQNLTYYVQKDNTGAFVPVTDAIYKWDNISVGTHTLKFRGDLNSTNCDFVQTFTITQPSALALNIDASKSDMYLGCNPATARVTMTATGGTPAYSYALYKGTTTITAAQASPQFTLTQAGTYTVKLTDANGCTIDKNFTISAAPTLTLTGTTVATQNNYCMSTATAGMVQVKVTAAPNVNTSPYTFFLNGTRVTNQTADAYTYTNLAVGTHTFTVIDKYGCVANYTTEIKRMIAVDGASGAVVVKDITCDAGAAGRGEITLKVKDGYAPYTYIVKDAANTIVQAAQTLPANNIATYSTATAGVYTIEVTDSKGCKVSGMATLTAAVRPTVVVTTTGVVCHGANDGTISLTISGGTAPYKVKLGATGAIQNVTGNQYRFVGVPGGSHTIYVTDARNCTREETVNVAAPTAPLRGFAVVSKLVGCGDTDGNPSHKDKAQVQITNVTGGYGTLLDYRYKFEGNFTASPLGWLPAGTHTVTVKDKSGCELDISVTVPKRIAPPTATTYTVTAYDCEGKGDIYISGLPNTYSYTYTIGGKTAIGTTATITGLAPGSYTMTIRYTQGATSCPQEIVKTVVVPSGLGLKASVLSQTNVDCNGRYTGKATFKLENLRGGTYNVYTGGSTKATGATSTTFEVTGLEAKTHTVTFKYTPAIVGGKTCDIDVPVTITQPTALTLAAMITEPAMCSNGNLAKVKLTANGGAGSYKYTYVVGGVVKAGPQVSNIFTSVAPGLASFIVKDANGCEKQLDLNTPVPAPNTVNFSISATDCYAADNQGVVTVKVTDGNGGYTMSLNGAAAVSPTTNSVTHSFTGLRQGTYTVTVRDQYGCSAVRAIDIHPSLNVKVNVTHQACAQAKIEVLTSGGSNDKGYKFYKAGTTPPANYNPINNTYSIPRFTTPTEDWVVQVKSGRCEKTYTETIKNVSLPTYTMIKTEPECHGTATGKIELSNLTGGAPFKVSVQRPGVTAAQTQVGVSGSYTITNAPAGVYTITIQDTFGCSSVHTITLADKPDLLLDGELKVDLSVNCPSAGNPTAMKLEFPQATFDAYNNNSDIYYSLDGHTWTKVTTHNFPLGAHPSFLPGATVTITYKTVSPKGGTATKCLTGVAQKTLPHRLNGLTVETNMDAFANGCTGLTQGMVATVTMSATGTSSTFQYSVDNYNWEPAVPTNDRTYVWTGLTPGRTYKFYVRDSQGCTAEAEGDFYAGTATPAVQVGLTVTPACSNTTQGNVNITIKRKSNYKPGLLTGTWRLYKLTSTPGQKRTGVATAHTGAINMPANTYQQVIPTFTAAAGEIYYVEVTEGTCTWGSRDAEMKQLAPITGTVKVSPKVTCDTAGVIEVLNAQGGGGQYTYTLSVVSGGGFINPIATANNRIEILRDNVLGASNLEYPSGVQTITVKVEVVDQYGCPGDLGNYAIGVQPKPKVYSAAYTGCSNGNFAITVTPTAKTTLPAAPATNIADYRYSIDGGLTWKDGINVFTGLSAGVYPIVLQEKSSGCEGIYTVTIHDPLEASARVSKPLGCGGANGEITIRIDKGSGNYTYNIVPPSGASLSGIPFSAVAGSTVSQVTHQIPSSYAPGTYTVTIKDTSVSNCSPTVIVLAVASPSYPEIEVSTYSVTCAGNNDGQLFVVEKNAPNAGTFSYTVTGPGGLVTFNMVSRSANNLVAGIYTITVTNTLTQCGKTYTATVYSPTSLTFNETLITSTDFVCSGGNTPRQAEITVPAAAINGGTGSIVIKYIAPNGAIGTGNVFSYGDPAGGVVTITITDASGCATSTVRTITAYEGLDAANVTVSSTITCLTDTITLSITQAGGAAFTPGTIYYAQGATAPTAAIGTAPWQTSGSFAVTPNDVHKFWIGNKKTGCIISYDYVSPNPNTFSIAKVAIKNVSCKGDSDGAVTLTLEDVVNTHNYNISVSPSAGVTITPATLTGGANVVNFSGLAPNTYTVTITDQNTLCKQTQVFTIAEPTVALTATTGVRSITCANNDGEIRIENVNGGWGGYQYYIDTVAPTPTSGAWTSTSVRSGLVSATYHIAVRDNKGKGCQITLGTIALTNPTTISGTLTVTQENCAAGTGKISVQTVTGGDGVNYNYQLIKDGVKEGIAQSTRTFTGLGAGSYEVVVSDAWGCSATLTAVNLYEPINNVQVHIAKEVTCASPREATLSVTHQGGSAAANLRYTITPLGGGTTTPSVIPVFTNIPAGSYVVGVKDILTACATVTYNIEVTPAVPVAFTYTQTAVGCHGGNDGTIIVTIPGTQTQTDYTIQIEGAGGFATRTETVNTTPKDFTLGGLAAGVYTVTVHSSRACQSVQTITISEPNQLVVSSTTVTTHFSCDANNQARQAIVQAIADGGATGTYTYNFVVFDGQNTNTTGYTNSSVVSISSNGSYTQTVVVYVRDANGCEANNVNSPTVIPPLKRITAIKAQQTRPIDCQGPEAVDFTIEGGSNQGYIVRVTGGTTTPSVQTITAGVSVASVTFTAPGYYEVMITDSATGCYSSVTYGIANYDNMSISVAQTKPVTCATGNDGELTLSMRGYAGNYTFRVVNEYGVEVVSSTAGRNDTSDPRTQPIGGLSAGKYYVEVTETQYPNCTNTTTLATLSGPSAALTASTTITDLIKCGSGQTGSFMVTAAGGWGNYQYRLTVGTPTPAAHSVYGNYTSTSVFEGLVPETYTVWIKDQNGCETSVTQVMSPPAPIAATVTKTDVKCFSKRGGSITINGTTGGSGNYTYELWEVGGAQIYGAQTSTTFAGLDAREYNVKIVDGWNCYLTIPVTIDEPQEIKVTASIVSPTTCLQTQATIQVTATGGLGGYQYQLGGTTTYTTSNLFTLPPGSYEFYVKDANDCLSAASNKVEVVAVPKLVLKVNKAEAFVKCSGEATARITFSATGGMGDYQYSLHQGNLTAPAMTISATQINTTDWAFSGLAIGTYFVKVKSGVDCQDNSSQIDIREADLISVTTTVTNITCKGKKDGEIVVTAIGGTGTKVYAISPRFDRVVESGVFKGLSAGEYVVRVQDANGCHTDEVITITEPDLLRVRIDQQTDEVCYGANDGTISVTITGGTQSYSTSIDGGVNWHIGKTLYTGLASGTYIIKVRDANGCEIPSDPITIKGGVDLQATATVEYSCPSNSVNNAVRVTVNADVAAQTTFALDGVAQASNYFTSVTAGVHTITIRHQGGCVQTLTVNVENYAPLSKTVSVTHITCYGLTNGGIQINVTGGTGSYTYSITPQAGTFSGTNMFVNLPKGQYTIQVKDAVIGCEVSERITIEEPEILELGTLSTMTETCYQQNDGEIKFVIQGGRAPYSYELKDPAGNVVKTATGVATGTVVTYTGVSGTYNLEYKDGSCAQTREIIIAAAPSLQAVATVSYECSTVSTTNTNPYIQITLARDNSDGLISSQTLSYSINGEPIKPFVGYVNDDTQVLRTRNIENNGVYTITIFYRPLGMTSLCSYTLSDIVSVTRYPGLEILDKTDPREINKVRVKVVGGNPRAGDTPYTIYFNNSYENGESEYMLKPTDPTSRVVNGRIFKLVVVEATDANNCTSTLTIEKEYMKSVPPDFFTPNGDGQNDGWDPDIYRSYPNLMVDIYDRYGRYIKTLRSGQVWDGRYEGKEMPSGDYWYILRTHEEGDAQEYMGHFTLYR